MVEYIGREVRLAKHVGVRELARKSGLAPSTISKWENGSAIPDLYALALAAKELNVKPWDLVKFS